MLRGSALSLFRAAAICSAGAAAVAFAAEPTLPGTQPWQMQGDLSVQMVDGIHRFLDAQTAASVVAREQLWHVDTNSPAAYEKSIAPNRGHLARMLGVIDPRVPQPAMELIETLVTPAKVAETDRFVAYAVRWPVLDGVHGEGLLLQPKQRAIARVVALPDADQTPEVIAGLAPGLPAERQFARRLAENGCVVVVPTLIDRSDAFSGSARLGRATNQPHREWIYRQAYELGRHIIGYEVQKVLAVVDWFAAQEPNGPVGVIGWGEGGLIGFYAAALDLRIRATAVSGYFGPREQLWTEPIYRNVFGLLREFGDAGVARLIAPRTLIVEPAAAPEISGPPAPRPRLAGAAPGRITTPTPADVMAEVERARTLAGGFAGSIHLIAVGAGTPRLQPERKAEMEPARPRVGEVMPEGISAATLEDFLAALTAAVGGGPSPRGEAGSERGEGTPPTSDRRNGAARPLLPPGPAPHELRNAFNLGDRQERQVLELERFTQRQLALAAAVRDEAFWRKAPPTTPERWREQMRGPREQFWSDVIGRYETGGVPPNPRTRRFAEQPAWTGYEVVLDVLPDVFAWGYLLLPNDLKRGERRPVVIVQHGLEGLPADTITEDAKSRAFAFYKAFGARLAERGFIVFAPHNPYRGEDRFRLIQRKANPLGKSLFSFIIAQHEVILNWLAAQPFVDPDRMAFYGLSYGGKTAMRVPAVLERYALSICSGDFNEWIWKNATTDWAGSYLFTKEWEMPEFALGLTFNYAEMAALIAPRPFMVERGHDDGVGLDEYVAFEYAKVKRLYDRLKIPERTAIEYFVGPHTINGVGTFEFLRRELKWPIRKD